MMSGYGQYLSDLSLVGEVSSMHPAMMRLDRERREQDRQRRYNASPAKDFHGRMSKHFDQYSQTYILMKNNMFIAYMDVVTVIHS